MKNNKMKAVFLGLMAVTMSSQILATTVSAAPANDYSSYSSFIDSLNNTSTQAASAPAPYASSNASSQVEKVISVGMSYMGTPYEFGSSRSTTKTFDCSDFVRHAYKQAIGVTLPSDSRQQGTWIRNNSTAKYSISQLQRGDLMFFGKSRGSSASAYRNVNPNSERITHVGIYLGNNQILHTYSKKSGGVRTDSVSNNQWENRFLFGGSVVK